MRVLTTLTFYPPHWTGLTVVARRLAEGMAKRGQPSPCSHPGTTAGRRHVSVSRE